MASRKRKIVAAVNDIVASSSKNTEIVNSSKVRPKHQKLKTIDAPSPPKLPRSFFEQECEDLATALLGKKLVRKVDNGSLLEGYIVETEAYVGQEDKAAHSYKGKRTARNEAMFMEPGSIYVYHIYGMYTCINISSKGRS